MYCTEFDLSKKKKNKIRSVFPTRSASNYIVAGRDPKGDRLAQWLELLDSIWKVPNSSSCLAFIFPFHVTCRGSSGIVADQQGKILWFRFMAVQSKMRGTWRTGFESFSGNSVGRLLLASNRKVPGSNPGLAIAKLFYVFLQQT